MFILKKQNVWLSSSGFPQEIIIDISDLKQYPIEKYNSFGIFCWHGYNSNPKIIELLINKNNDSKEDFISLGIFELELKTGKQIFPLNYNNIKDINIIKNIKNIRYIKIIIKENYGENWTYINQIMLFENNYK